MDVFESSEGATGGDLAAQPAAPPIDPASRRRPNAPGGIPIVIDGATWEVARGGLWKEIVAIRDRAFDQVVLTGSVEVVVIRAAAFFLLRVNYDLADDELLALVASADAAEIAEPVIDALLPISPVRRPFSAWARASLIASGLKPEDVPPADMPHVLETLVATGRAVPFSEYTEAGEAAGKRAGLLALGSRLAAEKPAPRDVTRETE